MAEFLAPILFRMRNLSRFCNANEVIDDVRMNVELLLNTRVSIPGDYLLRPTDPKHQEMLDGSLVNYGVADFQSLNMGDPQMEKRFCESVKCAIERFEPRLANVAVEMLASQHNRLISVQVQARLIVQPFEDIRLETGLDIMSQKFTVSA